MMSRDDGTPLGRLTTDGSGLAGAPAVVGNLLVAVTRNGGVYAFRPE
jgi:outer membrane protein assembly factor BamB